MRSVPRLLRLGILVSFLVRPVFAGAYALWKDLRILERAKRIREYLRRFLTTRKASSTRRSFLVGGILLADRELSRPPLHLTIIGAKRYPKERELFAAALRRPTPYKRVERWDEKEGPLPNPEVEYPKFDRAAAFVCTDRRCSAPIFEAAGMDKVLHAKNGVH